MGHMVGHCLYPLRKDIKGQYFMALLTQLLGQRGTKPSQSHNQKAFHIFLLILSLS